MKVTRIKKGHYKVKYNDGSIVTIINHISQYNEYESFWQAYENEEPFASAKTKTTLLKMISPK